MSPPTNQAYDQEQYEEDLTAKHNALQNHLSELTVLENYLFEEIRRVRGGGDDDKKDEALSKIRTRITNLKNVRLTLLKNLRELYTKVSSEISYNSRHIQNQDNMSKTLTNEIQKAETKLKQLNAEKNNKTRLAQVGEYEFEKNIEHRSILKTIVYSSFFILIITFLHHKNILPNLVTKVFIIIIMSITLLLLVQRFFWNFRRDNIDYSKFSQASDTPDDVSYPEKKNTLSLRKLLGMECNGKSLDSLATEAAAQKQQEETTNQDGGTSGGGDSGGGDSGGDSGGGDSGGMSAEEEAAQQAGQEAALAAAQLAGNDTISDVVTAASGANVPAGVLQRITNSRTVADAQSAFDQWKAEQDNAAEPFTNYYSTILPRQSCCVKSSCKKNKFDTNNIQFSLI